MLSVNQILKDLEDRLNSGIDATINGVFPGRHFLFNIYLDTGDFKEATFKNNVETYYINALAMINSSSAEGITVDAYNASVSATIDFLIPFANYQDEEGRAVFVENVRDYLASKLQTSQTYSMTDSESVTYSVGLQYAIANTGLRDVRDIVGDSMTLLVAITFFISADGVSSSDIEFELGDNPITENANYIRIYPSQHGLRRDSTTDINAKNGQGGATLLASVLTGSFEMPLRRNAVCEKAIQWLAKGRKEVLTLRVTFPIPNGSLQIIRPIVFDSVGLSCALNLNANLTCTFKEELTLSDAGGDE